MLTSRAAVPLQESPAESGERSLQCKAGSGSFGVHLRHRSSNSRWHDECTALLRPYNIGYYVGESDTVGRPSNAVESLSPENWKRLGELRGKYDPDGLFFGKVR